MLPHTAPELSLQRRGRRAGWLLSATPARSATLPALARLLPEQARATAHDSRAAGARAWRWHRLTICHLCWAIRRE